MRDFSHVLDELELMPGFQADAPATDDQVRRIESAFSIILPNDYVQFLNRYGSANWVGKWIFGVSHQTSQSPVKRRGMDFDSIRQTISARGESSPTGAVLPERTIVISDDGSGGRFALFDAQSEHAGKVAWFNFTDADEPLQEWPSFHAFLLEFIEHTRQLKTE